MGNVKYELMQEALHGMQNEKTVKDYKSNIKRFCDWCKEKHHIRYTKQVPDPKQLVQSYADDLVKQGKSASTIHSYLAPVCKGFRIPMQEIEKPLRIIAENVRSRDHIDNNKQGQQELTKPLYSRVVDFQSITGLRRSEIARVTTDSIKRDESGHLCVQVKGKGGKVQMQRIFPEDQYKLAAITGTVKEGEKLFSKKEMSNHIDFHGMRADVAKRAYERYMDNITNVKGYAENLAKEIEARWEANHKPENYKSYDSWKEAKNKFMNQIKESYGEYRVRGNGLALAKQKGNHTVYNRLAVLAVSVFHLSHWRLDVTINNYLNT